MTKCDSHPTYRGIRKPRSTNLNPGGCIPCWTVWKEKHPGEHPILGKHPMRRISDGGKPRLVRVVKHPTLPVEGYIAKFTQSCTGCFELGEYGSGAENYPLDPKLGIRLGGGCDECGYTGKRRMEVWVPFNGDEYLRADEAAREDQ